MSTRTPARKTKTETGGCLVTLLEMSERLGGVRLRGPDGAYDFTVWEQFGLAASDIVADWAGRPAVTPGVAARTVAAFEKDRIERARLREERKQESQRQQAETYRAVYLERLAEEILAQGYEKVDDWLKEQGFKTLEEYQLSVAKAERDRITKMRQPGSPRRLSPEEQRLAQLTPAERQKLKNQTAAAWERRKRELNKELHAKYPRP